jgi:hypothetical protein
MRSPARRKIVDSPMVVTSSGTVTSASSFACSSVTSTVIIFVMLAIARRCAASWDARTSPVAPFSTM